MCAVCVYASVCEGESVCVSEMVQNLNPAMVLFRSKSFKLGHFRLAAADAGWYEGSKTCSPPRERPFKGYPDPVLGAVTPLCQLLSRIAHASRKFLKQRPLNNPRRDLSGTSRLESKPRKKTRIGIKHTETNPANRLIYHAPPTETKAESGTPLWGLGVGWVLGI